jgi:hypothetical protein
MDVLYVGLIALFAAAMWAFAGGCARLEGVGKQ